MKKVWQIIYQGYRGVRECVMNFVFVIFVLICFSVVSLFTSGDKNERKQANLSGALVLNLDGYLADNRDEFGEFYRLLKSELGENEPIKISTFDVVRALMKAEKDPNITGLVIDLAYFQGGDIPSLQFVGQAIKDFKRSGKPVIAVGEYFSQKQYYLASFADQIYLNKAGAVDLQGLSYANLYFKALFDKIEAVPHIFRVGTYKSAVEPFLRNDMSPEARQNATSWLNVLWHNFRQDIADNRQIAVQEVLPIEADYLVKYRQAKGDEAQFALNQKWVTQLASNDEIQALLVKQFGSDGEDGYNRVDFFDYFENLPDRFNINQAETIAVINVEGEIIWGESDESSAGSDTIVSQLREARQNDKVSGVILRINSPGGSAMASELIRQEVTAIQKAGKPVVASMGGMAASGGYWIAATSDAIVASPTTLTGSIGIFGLAVTFEKTAQKVGVAEDGVTTSALASSSAFKTLSKMQGELIQTSIDNGYERFLALVAEGRKMSRGEVDKVAQGQVWSGEQAKTFGLVDQLGDFNTAYLVMADLLNQKKGEQTGDYPVKWISEKDPNFLKGLMRSFKLQARINIADWFGLPLVTQRKIAEPIGLINNFKDPKNQYLYCLNCGSVQ